MSPQSTPAAQVVSAHVDGAAHPNPGRGAWGVVLRSGGHEKRLEALEAEPAEEELGPQVRSRWQANMQSPGEENFVQDTPGSMRFGSAKVGDAPLSTGSYKAKREGQRSPVVVVPKEALEEHEKKEKGKGR